MSGSVGPNERETDTETEKDRKGKSLSEHGRREGRGCKSVSVHKSGCG